MNYKPTYPKITVTVEFKDEEGNVKDVQQKSVVCKEGIPPVHTPWMGSSSVEGYGKQLGRFVEHTIYNTMNVIGFVQAKCDHNFVPIATRLDVDYKKHGCVKCGEIKAVWP